MFERWIAALRRVAVAAESIAGAKDPAKLRAAGIGCIVTALAGLDAWVREREARVAAEPNGALSDTHDSSQDERTFEVCGHVCLR